MIGARVSELLREKGWTKAELARRAGVTRQAIWNICNGHDPSLATLRNLATALDTTEADLLEGASVEEPDEAA